MRFKYWLEADTSVGQVTQGGTHLQQYPTRYQGATGPMASGLRLFRNYRQIADLLKAVERENRKHLRLLQMMERGVQEASSTDIFPQVTTIATSPLYELERQILTTQKLALKNRFDMEYLLQQRGVDVQRHIRKAVGLPTQENTDATQDLPISQSMNLALDGPQFFPGGLQQLQTLVGTLSSNTSGIARRIARLLQQTPRAEIGSDHVLY